ncbi:MAG: hypothetical protein KBS67_06170, partial [Bacteroidales bacterium]|nr:hypothetical protein [Candidatus Cryptobacteroides equifaecalis]
TRRAQDETATQVMVGEFGEVKTSSVAAPVGSNFAVRNLFYNTPARRKFLKSDSVEFKHIIEEFTRVAITRPEVGFSLSHNGRDIYVLKPAKSLKFRVLDLLGSNVVGDVVDIDTKTTIVNVSGFIGKPDTARKTLGNQFFFVNGRYFRSAYLHKAVVKAYEDFIPEGMTPSYFIFLDADPESIDVNIHPTKTEIKFEDESAVFQTIFACVRATLGQNSFGASIDFETGGAVELPVLNSSFEQYRGAGISSAGKMPEPDPSYNPFDIFESSGPQAPSYGGGSFHTQSAVDRSQNYGKLFEDRTVAASSALVLQGKYIVTKAASGMMLVHVRRARERLLYEKYLKALSREGHVTQQGLFPVEINVGPASAALLQDNEEMLGRLGFDMEVAETGEVTVRGVPEGFSCEEGRVRSMVDDLLLILSDGTAALSELMNQRMAEKFSLLGVSNAETLESSQEAQRLVDALFASGNPDFTPSGKKIVELISLDEIDKKF